MNTPQLLTRDQLPEYPFNNTYHMGMSHNDAAQGRLITNYDPDELGTSILFKVGNNPITLHIRNFLKDLAEKELDRQRRQKELRRRITQSPNNSPERKQLTKGLRTHTPDPLLEATIRNQCILIPGKAKTPDEVVEIIEKMERAYESSMSTILGSFTPHITDDEVTVAIQQTRMEKVMTQLRHIPYRIIRHHRESIALLLADGHGGAQVPTITFGKEKPQSPTPSSEHRPRKRAGASIEF